MKRESALIFGYNEYGLEIAKNILQRYENVVIFDLDHKDREESSDFRVERFDLSDDWQEFENRYNMENAIAFCALNDEASNIFLIISLHSAFEKLSIIALANNKEDANKMYMAGASKVIPIVETTAGIISDMLEKPIVTKVLHKILYEDTDLKIEQLRVESSSVFHGKYPSEIDWKNKYSILLLSVIHEDLSHEFVYSAKAKHHKLQEGDLLVVVGYDTDLKELKEILKGER